MGAKNNLRWCVCMFGALALGWPAPAAGIVVGWTSPHTTVTLGIPFNELEFENPLSGTETVQGYKILEWRDADYSPGPPPWYDDWTVAGPGFIDGSANEIWMRQAGQVITTSTTVPSTMVSIHLIGDNNDGLVDVYVDGALVAQLDMFTPGNDRAFVLVKGLANAVHNIEVRDMGPSQQPGAPAGADDVATLGAAALAEDVLYKWDQPPDPVEPDNVFLGWNQYSVWDPDYGQLAADDWYCDTNGPVTKIRWWGSYVGWRYAYDPPQSPDHFHIHIWTDVPTNGTGDDFSHPGRVIHEVLCYNFTYEWVGWDYNPATGDYESCFKFEQELTPTEYFHQEPGGNIYWISIAACYGGTGTIPDYPWGWKTRPRDPDSLAPDDAVRIFEPRAPVLGDDYIDGEPIFWPTEEHSWDLAFELISGAPTVKWVQLPNLMTTGVDVNATSNGNPPDYILANDFECTTNGAITDIRIWGSWDDDAYPSGGAGAVDFTLSIHADIPDPDPGDPTTFSMPGNVLWWRTFRQGEFQVSEYMGNIEEGWLDPPDDYRPNADWTCWQYDFFIDPAQAFWQEGTPTDPVVYWLDVQAHPLASGPRFGWKTSDMQWNDAAVWGDGSEPFFGPWNELRYPINHPFHGGKLDLAFKITTGEGELVKWSQPPQPYVPDDGYNGWNELSMYDGQQIVADDWLCTNGWPVSDIHWWGSFLDWGYTAPPHLPDKFHIGIWTDVPTNGAGGPPFSHPGVMIHQILCDDFTWEFVGWDWFPYEPLPGEDPFPPEACFKFEQKLDVDDWFWQEASTNGTVYWVSIAAMYTTIPEEYPWGWKTRPNVFNDAAVVIWDPTAPAAGAMYVNGAPLVDPDTGDWWDMAFQLTTHVPKWSQPPHGPGEGFDAASDFWWYELKWLQEPNLQLSGMHAHDWQDAAGGYYFFIKLADDWRCDGGEVTDLHWWGSYESVGQGIDRFHLSIHECDTSGPVFHVPLEPPAWEMNVPFADVHETDTGLVNGSGQTLYSYHFDLPDPYPQTPNNWYWFDVMALSVDPSPPNAALWYWQEANRSSTYLGHAPGAEYTDSSPWWQSIIWTNPTEYSDFAFAVTSRDLNVRDPNKVVADDFVSDGRPIKALRWWGSYLDELYEPHEQIEPYIVDGWFISFHHTVPDSECPPDAAAGDDPTVLGVYFAPVDAVNIVGPLYQDCWAHNVYQYVVDLSQCCLLCSEQDPRVVADPSYPAREHAFLETCGLGYWLDIQAVVGVTWDPDVGCAYGDRILTGHVPSDQTADQHFWGWHTSFVDKLEEACTGRICNLSSYPPDCWDYRDWNKQPWECPPPEPPVNMSFELLATAARPPNLIAAHSVAMHGTPANGYVELALPIGTGGVFTGVIEHRVFDKDGLTIFLRLTFDANVDPTTLVISGVPNLGVPVQGAALNIVEIPFTAEPGQGSYTLDVSGGPCATIPWCRLIGDVNCDGGVATSDLGIVSNPLNFGKNVTTANKPRADVNRDNNITTGDMGVISNPLYFGVPVGTITCGCH